LRVLVLLAHPGLSQIKGHYMVLVAVWCYINHLFTVTRLEICLDDVSRCMAANCLKLNAEKTELLWAGSRYSAQAQLGSSGLSVQFGTEVISAMTTSVF